LVEMRGVEPLAS